MKYFLKGLISIIFSPILILIYILLFIIHCICILGGSDEEIGKIYEKVDTFRRWWLNL